MIFTYRDAIEHCRSYLGGGADAINTSDLYAAIQAAYRDVSHKSRYKFRLAESSVWLVPPFSEGTISYDHTGGTYERQVTLSDAAWPSWAQYGRLVIDDQAYLVQAVKSSTVLQLKEDSNPGRDIEAGTGFRMYRDSYTLPSDWVSIDQPGIDNHSPWMEPMRYSDLMALQRASRYTEGTPIQFAIGPDMHRIGRFAIYLWPWPDSSQVLSFCYGRKLRPLRVSGFAAEDSKGTVAGDGTNVITGTGVELVDAYKGAVIRVGRGNSIPSGWGTNNPPDYEAVIVDFEAGNKIVLSDSVGTFSGRRFVISDPVDLDDSVLNFFLRSMEYELSLRQNRTPEARGGVKAAYDAARWDADEAQSKYTGPMSAYDGMSTGKMVIMGVKW